MICFSKKNPKMENVCSTLVSRYPTHFWISLYRDVSLLAAVYGVDKMFSKAETCENHLSFQSVSAHPSSA